MYVNNIFHFKNEINKYGKKLDNEKGVLIA